jgi:hypothetical protein
MEAARPRKFVELGTLAGVSFSAFCNSAREFGLETECIAVDTWVGDQHTGKYGENVYYELSEFVDENFSGFATLERSLFDDAISKFADRSVDLLHIDGLHTYEAVKHDFESWLPKMSERGVILFHDVEILSADFGVWKLWNEVAQKYPNFKFDHSAGLGVLAVGPNQGEAVNWLCSVQDQKLILALQARFESASDAAYLNGREVIKSCFARYQTQLGENIAPHAKCSQSSAFEEGAGSAQAAVSGISGTPFAFHTKLELRPWWMCEFGQAQIFDNILIYNRIDGPCAERANKLAVYISMDGNVWEMLYEHKGPVFGGVNDGLVLEGARNQPLHISCSKTKAKFVKVQLNDENYLHLVQIEIYALE